MIWPDTSHGSSISHDEILTNFMYVMAEEAESRVHAVTLFLALII